MSIYECSITNPKKQLEFYKDLSEQLQQENRQLKRNCNIGNENLIFYKQQNQQLKATLEEIREYLLNSELCFREELIQIIDKEREEK